MEFGGRSDADFLDLSDPPFIDLAQESQRQVNVFGPCPADIGAGAPQIVLQSRERGFDLGRNLDGDEGSHDYGVGVLREACSAASIAGMSFTQSCSTWSFEYRSASSDSFFSSTS